MGRNRQGGRGARQEARERSLTMPVARELSWPAELRRYVDPLNERKIIVTARRSLLWQWPMVLGGLALIVIGLLAVLGLGGVQGAPRYVFGPIFIAVGVLLGRVIWDVQRWFSLELRENVWVIRRGKGRRAEVVKQLPASEITSRITQDDEHGSRTTCLVLENLTVQSDEALPTITVGERFNLPWGHLEAICSVIAERANASRSTAT